MEYKTDDNRDYDVVIAKMPRRDKDGNDISTHKMGPGGRRKRGGSLSGLAYDFELFEEPDTAPKQLLITTEEKDCVNAVRNEVRQDNFDQFLYYLDLTVDFLERHPEVAVKIKDGVVFLGRSIAGVYREAKTKLTWTMPRIPLKLELPHKRSKHERVPITERKIRATKIVEAEKENLYKREDENESCQNATMTIKQARAEVLKVLAHWIEIKRSLQRLSDCDYIELQKLGLEGVIAQLEGIAQQYPALMDEDTVTRILQFSFDDLERKRIKEALMIDPQRR